MRRAVVVVVAIALVGLAAAGLVRAATPSGPASEAERVEQIASTLRCPTCQGLSVADSPSKVAESMRDIIAEQLAAGRTDEEIQAWFVDRYGEWVLLSPPSSGLGWAVWVLPLLALAVGVTVAIAVAQRGRVSLPWLAPLRGSPGLRWAGVVAAFSVAVAVTLVAAIAPRGAGDLPTGNVAGAQEGGDPPVDDTAGLSEQATVDELEDLRAAVERDPEDVTARLQLSAALLQAGRSAEVPEQLQPVLDEHPDEPDAILLLGIAQIQQGDPAAPETLERYLQVAPEDHEGRPVAEGLLDRSS